MLIMVIDYGISLLYYQFQISYKLNKLKVMNLLGYDNFTLKLNLISARSKKIEGTKKLLAM